MRGCARTLSSLALVMFAVLATIAQAQINVRIRGTITAIPA